MSQVDELHALVNRMVGGGISKSGVIKKGEGGVTASFLGHLHVCLEVVDSSYLITADLSHSSPPMQMILKDQKEAALLLARLVHMVNYSTTSMVNEVSKAMIVKKRVVVYGSPSDRIVGGSEEGYEFITTAPDTIGDGDEGVSAFEVEYFYKEAIVKRYYGLLQLMDNPILKTYNEIKVGFVLNEARERFLEIKNGDDTLEYCSICQDIPQNVLNWLFMPDEYGPPSSLID